MNLLNLKLINFLSFRELDYSFEKKPVLIQGENLTEPESQESNGSGKSSVQSAIEFIIFKTTLKEKESDLIFWGEDEATVELTIECPIRNQVLVITRVIKMKGSSSLDITINTEPVSVANVNDGNDFIIKWIGISKEDLQNYFILNKERYKSFFSASNKEKVEMISRFSNAKLVNGVDKVVQTEIIEKDIELRRLGDEHVAIKSKIFTLDEQIQLEKNRDIETEIQEEIELLSQQIHLLKTTNINHEINIGVNKNIIITHQKSIPILNKEIEELNHKVEHERTLLLEIDKQLSNLNSFNQDKDYNDLDTKLSEIRSNKAKKKLDYGNLLDQSKSINEILSEISKNISGSVKCPKCSHEFLPGDGGVDIEAEKQDLISTSNLSRKVQDSLDAIDKDLLLFEQSVREIDEEKLELSEQFSINLEKIRVVKRQVDSIENKIKEYKTEIDENEKVIKNVDQIIEKLNNSNTQIEQQIEFNLQTIKGTKQQIEETKNKKIDWARIKLLEEFITEESKNLNDVATKIEAKNIEIFETTQWLTNFKRFDMFMANNSLKIIQGYCNKFLQSIKSDIQIRWEGIKVLSNGQLRENITPYIIRNSEIRSFWSFSGGERVRMEFSMIMTLQRMINSTNKWGGLDLLCMDEVMEGNDSLGLQSLMKSLSELNKTIMITTHVVNRSIGDNILLVRKTNGISQIVKN